MRIHEYSHIITIVLGALGFLSLHLIGTEIAHDGTLVEPFALMPIGYLLCAIGFSWGLATGIVRSLKHTRYVLAGLFATVLVALVALGASVFFTDGEGVMRSNDERIVQLPAERVWERYEDTQRGFSIEYPSNVASPDTNEEPTFITFPLHERYGGTSARALFTVTAYPTEFLAAPVTNVHEWIEMRARSIGEPVTSYTTTTIAGVEASNVGDYSFTFVHHGRVYSISLRYPELVTEEDRARIINSFEFR